MITANIPCIAALGIPLLSLESRSRHLGSQVRIPQLTKEFRSAIYAIKNARHQPGVFIFH